MIRSLQVPVTDYLMRSWHRFDARPVLPAAVAVGVSAPVEVNDSRWIVRCPNPACNGAQIAHKDDRRLFCVDCLNEHVGGMWVQAAWPDDVSGIEAALLERPLTDANGWLARCWVPGETVDDLKAETEAHKATP